MKYKRNFVIILVAIVIYIILTVIYNNVIIKSNEMEVFVLKEDIVKGKEITLENIDVITIKPEEGQSNYVSDILSIKDKLTNLNVYKGQMLTLDMFCDKSSYVQAKNDEEIVAIKIKSSEDSSSYNIGKNTLANIYYTGKSDYANDILKDINTSNIVSGGNPGYITVKLFDKVEIINVFDKYGNEITSNNLNNTEIVIDTILINTNSKMAMTIYNLARYGDFSISVLN